MRKFIRSISVIFIVITLTFFLIRLMPGNPVDAYILNLMRTGVPYDIARQRASSIFSFDLNKPIFDQYAQYMSNLLKGDLGVSIVSTGTPVASMIGSFLPWTLFSVSLSLLASFVIGIALGTILAYRRGGPLDIIVSTLGTILNSIPNYILAILFIVFIGVQWKLYPMDLMRGAYSSNVKVGFTVEFISDVFKHVLGPFLVYVTSSFGGWMLSMKASTVSVLGEDYINLARAKGLKGSRISTYYIGRTAILPLFTSLATSLGYVAGGSVLIETLFVYKGIGSILWDSISGRDYTLMQGCFLVITVMVVMANFLADLLYGLIDPRVRVHE